jgi:hypothetical protein
MEFLENNYQNIILVLGAVYPPLLFLLPPQIASKIDIGIKVLKTVADSWEKAKNTKGGLSTTSSSEIENKTFIQKSKS